MDTPNQSQNASETIAAAAEPQPAQAANVTFESPITTDMSHNVSECPTFTRDFDGQAAQTARGDNDGDDDDESKNRPPDLPNDSLTERQRAAMELVLVGKSDIAVAKAVGVDRRTIHRWKRDDERFGAELRQRREELWSGIVDRLGAMLDPAVDILAENLTDSLDRNRYRAAVSVLRLSNVRKAIPFTEETS